MVTVFAYCQSFTSFSYHHHFPMLLSFEVLHFVYMVHFKGNIGFATQLAGFGRKS